MTTYRERRLAKAERLREWAEKRNAKATADLNSNPSLRHDWAFITQPGHIPERARMNASDDRAFASMAKAASMKSRAAGIEHAADRSIYSDDPDAVQQVEARIVDLEARREHMKAANAAFRKSHKAELAAEQNSYTRSLMMPFQAYKLANLSGNITRQRERLKELAARAQVHAKADANGGVAVEANTARDFVQITFPEFPGREMVAALKDAGMWYQFGRWSGPVAKLPTETPAGVDSEIWTNIIRQLAHEPRCANPLFCAFCGTATIREIVQESAGVPS